MTRVMVSSETPCVIAGFDPVEDILVIALPEDADGGLDHELDFRRDPSRDFLEVVLSHTASAARFIIRLPGVAQLDPSAIAVLSLAGAEQLARPSRPDDTATLTGDGIYPPPPAHPAAAPGAMTFVHRHSWYRDGPPNEQFFDLSDPKSELTIQLETNTGGPIYAIRLTEKSGRADGDAYDQQHSIILAQTAPGTPKLSAGVLAQWFATRLGSREFRVVAWVWLGNQGHYTDTATGHQRRFGRVNLDPLLAIKGQIAGSIAIER